ncbi:MAG: cyclic-di-AMP receptor [Anaerolineales bacterium]|nr:cyclic-di-AMP receptor [Anaerolineales bacterium]
MKLILAVIQDIDRDYVSQALITASFRVTHIASTGGFLRRGSTTFMIGVDDEKVEQAIEIIRQNLSPETDPATRRATLFVLKVDNFTQL